MTKRKFLESYDSHFELKTDYDKADIILACFHIYEMEKKYISSLFKVSYSNITDLIETYYKALDIEHSLLILKGRSH